MDDKNGDLADIVHMRYSHFGSGTHLNQIDRVGVWSVEGSGEGATTGPLQCLTGVVS